MSAAAAAVAVLRPRKSKKVEAPSSDSPQPLLATKDDEEADATKAMRPVQMRGMLLFAFVFMGSIYVMWKMWSNTTEKVTYNITDKQLHAQTEVVTRELR